MSRILSLDGGGCHCLAQAILLRRIFEKFPDFYNQIDLFTGTSAGGLLALALADKGPAALALFCPETLMKIFKRRWTMGMIPSEGLTSSKYGNIELKTFLDEQFGNKTLEECEQFVFIPAFKLSNSENSQGRWHPEFFTNYYGSSNSQTLMRDVGLRTSAAPTYFPIYQNYSDGGIFANNPASCALVHCASQTKIDPDEYRVLSLSGGCQAQAITEVDGDWGLYQWVSSLVSMLIDANVYVSNDVCRQLIGDNYHRYQLPLPEDVALDGINQLEILIQAAESANLDKLFEWISTKWN